MLSTFIPLKMGMVYRIIIAFILFSCVASAQQTLIYTHEDANYLRALDLYDKEKYVAAQQAFEEVLKTTKNIESEIYSNAVYYSAMSAAKVFNEDAEERLMNYISNYPESPKIKLASYELGLYYFRKKKYTNAVEWLTKIDVYDLSNEDLAEYYFKLGYSYFKQDNYTKASDAFYQIKDTDTRYTSAARYYYAHIAYEQKKYETALTDFRKIETDETFSAVVPYYIVQILYIQQKYDELLAYAPAMMDTVKVKREEEISRLIGEAYYHKKQYEEAIPFLEKYTGPNYYNKSLYYPPTKDAYQLGFSYFKIKEYAKAIQWFQKSVTDNDSLSQLGFYHIGECYYQLGQKDYAKDAFRMASKMDFYPDIKKEALFSFAKLAYETSNQPFNDAILAFEEFINEYPEAKENEEAYEYLVGVYFTTKNYAAAIESLDRIKEKNYKLKEAYQKVAFYRAIELYNAGNYKEALTYFDKSDKFIESNVVAAQVSYWRAETLFKTQNYKESANTFEALVLSAGSALMEEYSEIPYNTGYSYFMMAEYTKSNTWFRRYIENSGIKEVKKNDALLRIADGYYLLREYKNAVEYYDKAAFMGKLDRDYAIFQSALANGLDGNLNDKASLLQTLVSDYENGKYKTSPYIETAIFELAKTYSNPPFSDNPKALSTYKRLLKDYPNSELKYSAMLNLGLVHYNMENDDEALAVLKEVYSKSPVATERDEAFNQIKRIYEESGKIDELEAFLKASGVNYDTAELEKTMYDAGRNAFLEGNCDKATTTFTKYIEKYPSGSYLLDAHFQRAECEKKANFMNEALMDYDYVLKTSFNKYSEKAAESASYIAYNLNKMPQALGYFLKLESYSNTPNVLLNAREKIMNIAFDLHKCDTAITYASKVMADEKTDGNLLIKAKIIKGECLFEAQKIEEAKVLFNDLKSDKGIAGAKSNYYLAQIQYLEGKYKDSEKAIFSLIKAYSGYHYWVAKSFILLSDNYVALNDLYQAKVALQNVIDNYKGDDELRDVALEKLRIIEQTEKDNSQKRTSGELEIDLGKGDDSQNKPNKDKNENPEE